MRGFIEQVKHNENLHTYLCQSTIDKFHDWKITCLFYCAYHLIQALASKKRIKIGKNHAEIFHNLNPRFSDRSLQIKKDAFEAYDRLFEYSRTARYEGFVDFEVFQQLKVEDYKDAIISYTYLKKYVSQQGVTIETDGGN